MLRIDPNYLRLFDGRRFADLLNALISAEAGFIGVSLAYFDSTVAVNIGDNGIDARFRHPVVVGIDEEWLPNSVSNWQYKSGHCPSSNAIKDDELTKLGVQNCIARDEYYCFITADSITADKKERIRNEISNAYLAQGKQPKYLVYSGDDLVNWALKHPAIAVEFFNIPIEGWYSHKRWGEHRRFRNDFISDETRDGILYHLASVLQQEQKSIYLIGYSGIGKTRTVYEALKHPGLSERTLYAPDASILNSDLFWHFSENHQVRSGVLVIDECGFDRYQRYSDLAERLPDGFRLICIGPTEDVRPDGSIVLDKLTPPTIESIIQNVCPLLNFAQVEELRRKCEGFPRLAVLLGDAIYRALLRGENINWDQIERSASDAVFNQIFRNNDDIKHVMRVVSLFTRLGWREEVIEEGRSAMEFFGIDWNIANDSVMRLHEQGVISFRGRYIYPTPEVLANDSARSVLEIRDVGELREFYQRLSTGSQESLALRFRSMGGNQRVREAVEQIIGEVFFFRDIRDLENLRDLRFLSVLAPTYPQQVLQIFNRVMQSANQEELKGLRRARRIIIEALDEILWWSEYFKIASRLILKLAWAENETYLNSATGIWKRLFQVYLSGTSTTFEERWSILDEALQSDIPEIRQLGVIALGSILQTRNINGFGGPPHYVYITPPTEWRPSSSQEWYDIIRQAINRLKDKIQDESDLVRKAVVKALAEHGVDLITFGLMKEWSDLVTLYEDNTFETRNLLLRPVQWGLDYAPDLSVEDKDLLLTLKENLVGQSFSNRLRQTLSEFDALYELRHPNENPWLDLAQEVIDNPILLAEELNWLVAPGVASPFRFGEELGNIDGNLQMLDLVISIAETDFSDDRFLSGYMKGVSEHKGLDWLEKLIEEWSQKQEMSKAVSHIIWRVISTNQGAKILTTLINKHWISASFLENLIVGFWAKSISASSIADLIRESLNQSQLDGAIRGRLAVLAQYLDHYPETIQVFQDMVQEIFIEALNIKIGAIEDVYSDILFGFISKFDITPLAERCIEILLGGADYDTKKSVNKLFGRVIEHDRDKVFREVLGPAIVQNPELIFILDNPIEGRNLLNRFDPKDILNWIEEDVENRLRIIAHATPVYGSPLQGLARLVLERFGDREGVRSSLAATFSSGSFWGHESTWLQSKLDRITPLLEDQNPNVRLWAEELATGYRKEIRRAKILEEEEDLR
jgi:hypothetical protein